MFCDRRRVSLDISRTQHARAYEAVSCRTHSASLPAEPSRRERYFFLKQHGSAGSHLSRARRS